MLLTIQKIENIDKAILVTGVTPCGTLKGIWKDDGSNPLQGKSYNVELTLGLNKQTTERKDVIIEKTQTEHLIAIQYPAYSEQCLSDQRMDTVGQE